MVISLVCACGKQTDTEDTEDQLPIEDSGDRRISIDWWSHPGAENIQVPKKVTEGEEFVIAFTTKTSGCNCRPDYAYSQVLPDQTIKLSADDKCAAYGLIRTCDLDKHYKRKVTIAGLEPGTYQVIGKAGTKVPLTVLPRNPEIARP
jgi:hypothetical protein